MPDDIALLEVKERNAIDIPYYFKRLNKSRTVGFSRSGRKVYLGDIAGNRGA